jgi:hypothetical protein
MHIDFSYVLTNYVICYAFMDHPALDSLYLNRAVHTLQAERLPLAAR